jgi:hypothetical protein
LPDPWVSALLAAGDDINATQRAVVDLLTAAGAQTAMAPATSGFTFVIAAQELPAIVHDGMRRSTVWRGNLVDYDWLGQAGGRCPLCSPVDPAGRRLGSSRGDDRCRPERHVLDHGATVHDGSGGGWPT